MADSVTDPRTFVAHALRRRGVEVPEVPPDCIITHSASVLEAAKAEHAHRVVDIGVQRALPVHLFSSSLHPDFGMVAGCQGAPMAVMALEELCALGFSRFWCVGTAGHPTRGLPSTLAPGDFVLVDRALVREGTTDHYAPGARQSRPDPRLRERLAASLRQRALPFATGTVATTDALYRETPAFLEDVVGQGAVALDMELSALFTVAAARGVAMAAVLVVSDVVPVAGPWVPAFGEAAVTRSEAHLLPVLLDALGRG